MKKLSEKQEEADSKMKDLSAIKIFGYIQKTIERLNSYPLAEENFDLNDDAYGELGSDTDEDLVFAHIGMDYPKKYTELAFGMIFAKHGVGLSVGGQEYVFERYELLGKDEKDIAGKLESILIGLANGQLAILNTITQDNEKLQAWEILYRKPSEQLYDALATYAIFDSARKLKNRELVTQKFANAADIKDVDVDIDTYKLFMFETTWLNKFNRKQITGLHIPLTRKDWEKSVDKYYDDKADAFVEKIDAWATVKDKKSFWQQVTDAAKWRHLELMWFSLAFLLYEVVTKWSIEHIHPGLIVFGTFVVAATIYRSNPSFYKYFPYMRFSAYAGFIISAVIFFSNFDGSIWWYTLGIIGLVSLLENIFFDIYGLKVKSVNHNKR